MKIKRRTLTLTHHYHHPPVFGVEDAKNSTSFQDDSSDEKPIFVSQENYKLTQQKYMHLHELLIILKSINCHCIINKYINFYRVIVVHVIIIPMCILQSKGATIKYENEPVCDTGTCRDIGIYKKIKCIYIYVFKN